MSSLDEMSSRDAPGQPPEFAKPTGKAHTAERPTAATEPVSSEFSLFTCCGIAIGAAALFNFISLPIARGAEGDVAAAIFFGGIMTGVYTAELGVLTLWLVFGPGQFWWRLCIHWIVAFGLFAAWALGFAAAVGSDGPPGGLGEVWGVTLCALPFVTLAAQLPLWIMRIYSGWRIERPAIYATAETPQPLMIRDLFAGMMITGVSLAALRLMPEELHRDSDFWIAWGIAVVSITAASAFSLLPAIGFVLRIRETGTAALAWFGYTGAMLVATLVVASMFMRSGPPGEAVVGVLIAFFSFAGVVSFPLFFARTRGYRLRFPSDPASATFVVSQEMPHDRA